MLNLIYPFIQARDGGLPYSAFFARQNARFGVPFNSIILATILVIIFGVLVRAGPIRPYQLHLLTIVTT